MKYIAGIAGVILFCGGVGGCRASQSDSAGPSQQAKNGAGSTPAASPVHPAPNTPAAPTGQIWPNASSSANSDAWLAAHHDEIVQMKPKVLVVSFLQPSDEPRIQAKLAQVKVALEEASRFHGYTDPKAGKFFDYQIAALRTVGEPFLRLSSTAFDHHEFVNGTAFAKRLGILNPKAPTQFMTICQLFEQGMINDVWVFEHPDDAGKLYESKGIGQMYDEQFHKIGKSNVCASNGCIEDTVTCSVTVRLQEMNLDRGLGCATHAFGHGIEGLVKSNDIPYFKRNASRFFNFAINERYPVSISDFYDCQGGSTDCVRYLSPAHIASGTGMNTFDIPAFGDGCGNIHFAPHSRYGYDYEADSAGHAGLASCASYGLGNGPGGKDAQDQIAYQTYQALNEDPRYSDCGGGWMIYLRQSMPGLGNKAKDTAGQPMKNWLPFLYY